MQMIEEFVLENCGPLEKIHWNVSPKINLVTGTNSTGKSIMLKMLYVMLRSTEDYKRGNNTDSFKQIVGDKLRGTFQVEHVGDLVKKGESRLKLECQFSDQKLTFSFSPSAEKGVGDISVIVKHREPLSHFIPPKEILSLTNIIRRSRLQDRLFGFDDTYLDLAIALDGDPQKGNNYKNLVHARNKLSEIFDGRLEKVGDQWQFKQGNSKHSIHITAEGIKRLTLIDRLIGNKSLSKGSVLFVDEPEAMLHPKAITEFMEILYLLASEDIQIFLASHSYFVLKSLYIIAKRESVPISILSLGSEHENNYDISDLQEGIPENAIVNESISLYERELIAELKS